MEVVGGLRAEIRVNSPKLPGIAAFSRSAVWLGVVHDQQHTSLEQRAPYDVGSWSSGKFWVDAHANRGVLGIPATALGVAPLRQRPQPVISKGGYLADYRLITG
jgi:hypothetical protein